MTPDIHWLGRIGYAEALSLQEKLVAARGERTGGERDLLLLLEHEPVYTIGRTRDQSSLRDAAHLPHPVIQINRGGEATYHGPGQLVGYPILDLKTHGADLHLYLRELEETLILALARYGVEAGREAGLTGVWVNGRKIASIGVGVRRWISMHGFALNVCGNLAPFSEITPCGIAGVEMTSIERETGHSITVEAVARTVGEVFLERFGPPGNQPASDFFRKETPRH